MYNRSKKVLLFLSLFSLFSSFSNFTESKGFACSRVLSANNGQAVISARNMDWPERTDLALWFLPRGIDRAGLTEGNSLTWTAKYSSIIAASSVKGMSFASDGINEKGLAANLLWLNESDYGKREENIPGISVALWAQYVLDNYATVNEVVENAEQNKYQIVATNVPMYIPTRGTTITSASLHLALADKSGDSAIIEYINGKPIIYHNRNYTIMTNSPSFEKQQENLKQYQGFGGNKPIPGTSSAPDRFVRAAYYMKNLPKPNNLQEALAYVFSVTRNASQPFIVSVDPKNPYTSATIWRSVADLTNGYYYYESTISPYIIWADFGKFNSKAGNPALKLDLSKNPNYNGNVSTLFTKADPKELKAPKF